MKEVTFITTTAVCDDTFDKITHLNNGFHSDHFKNDIIVFRGNFMPDVFEWVDNTNNPGYARYCNQSKPSVSSEQYYDNYLEALPPIYFTHLDGNKVSGGFCVSEAYTHTSFGVPVFTGCYKQDGQYFETLVILLKNSDNYIRDYNSQEYSRDNYAITYRK